MQKSPQLAANAGSSSYDDPYFVYTALPNGSIRLIKFLEVGQHHSCEQHFSECMIQVSLEHFEMASCPEYVAISYTWGPASIEKDPATVIFTQEPRCFPIFCGNKLLLSTKNLRDALYHLRGVSQIMKCPYAVESQTRKKAASWYSDYYWIDAICINQDDLDERAQQVVLMDKIYRRSKGCIAWLGKTDQSAREAMQFAVDCCKDRELHDFSRSETGLQAHQAAFIKFMNYGTERLCALEEFFSRSWFSRLWVVQEAVLAPQVVFMCGTLELPFIVIANLAKLMCIPKLYLMITSARSKESRQSAEIPLVGPGSFMVTTQNLARISQYKASLEQGDKLDLLTALEMSYDYVCSDPRDQIYGILGIVSLKDELSEQSLPVDYNQTTEVVFKQATYAIARQRNDAAFLYWVGYNNERERKRYRLPSWCPSYAANRQFISPHIDLTTHQRWLRKSSRSPLILFDGNILHINGDKHGTIDAVVELDSPEAVSRLLKMTFDSREDYITRMHTLWKTLSRNEINETRPGLEIGALFLSPVLLLLLLLDLMRFETVDGSSVSKKKQELETCASILEQIRDRAPQCRQYLLEPQRVYQLCELLSMSPPQSSVGCKDLMELVAESGIGASPEMQSRATMEEENSFRAKISEHLRQEIVTSVILAQHLGLEADLCQLLNIKMSENFFVDASMQMPGLLRDTMHILSGLSVFCTRGSVGQCFSWIRENDQLWLLDGFPSPVVLRQLKSNRFQFLGPAYVHDIGDADVIHTERFWSKLQRIEIE